MGLTTLPTTEEDAREMLERLRWPSGPVCPACGARGAYRLQAKEGSRRPVRPGVYKCKSCRKQFSVTVGTIMEGSHIPLRKWIAAFDIVCASKKGVSALQLQRQLELGSYKTAWHLAHRIRYAMRHEPLKGVLRGVVEVDETYVGGKAKIGRRVGRGSPTKTPVVALVSRDGNARAFPVERVDAKTLKGAIRDNVALSATIMTDDFGSYRGLHKEFPGGHFTVNHTAGEYSRGEVHTNTVESFFALLKRGVYGSFHHVSKRHLHRYCDEFAFRWNHRKDKDWDRTKAALRLIVGKRLYYREPLQRNT